MLSLDASSFAPLAEFPLRWRFTTSPAGEPAPHFAGRLRPLTSHAAAAVTPEATARCTDSSDFTTTFRSDDPPALVRSRLVALDLPPDEAIVVWWNPTTALVTDWALFAEHWDDFCYPAADSVCIWPVAGEWTLCYRRYEVLQFRAAPLDA